MKKAMTSVDIAAAIHELQVLINAYISNIYLIEEQFFVLKFRGASIRGDLVIEPGKRIHLSTFKRETPKHPSEKVMILRRFMKGARIININQRGFDRLVILSFAKEGKDYRAVIELFGKGNFVVIDANNRVVFALWYRKMRDRDLLPGKQFEFPPVLGTPLIDITFDNLTQSIESEDPDVEVVRFLAKSFSGGGPLVEEILHRATIPKNQKLSMIKPKELDAIIKAAQGIREQIYDTSSLSPVLVKDEEGEPVNCHPFPYQSQNNQSERVDTFNTALDQFFSPIEGRNVLELRQYERKRQSLEKTLMKQKEHLDHLLTQAEDEKNLGNLVYEFFQPLNELLEIIKKARKDGHEWSEIKSKLELGKEKGINSATIFEAVKPSRSILTIRLANTTLNVDFRKSPSEIAEEYYSRAKKADRKILPAKEAIAQTEKKLQEIEEYKGELLQESQIRLKKRSRRWYEKYRWTHTLQGFLVIGGRDAKTNREIAQRRMRAEDLFFHADLSGAPYVILKLRDEEETGSISTLAPQEQDIYAAAHLAGVYSRAWSAGRSSVDVYYVNSDQVSFSAPSGEFLPRGGIMVRGKRTYVKNIPLRLAIGLVVEEDHAYVIGGLLETISKRTSYVVQVSPGDLGKGKAAQHIKKILANMLSNPEDKIKLKAIDLNEFVAFLPGDCKVTPIYP
ncbi:MAG: ribosome rescue protein RqcH [Candidatus Hermodarchaeota archaeon]